MTAPDDNALPAPQQFELIDDPAKISKLLERLQGAHTLLSVRVPGGGTSYNSMILQIDPDKDWITLDELHPAEGHAKLLETRRLSVSGDFDGVELRFDGNMLSCEKQSNIFLYRITFPEQVKYFQRRSSFRVRVLGSTALPVILLVGPGNYIQGQLYNVSAGGIAIRFNRALPAGIARGQTISECEMRLSAREKIVCPIEIRHIAQEGKTGNTLVGVRFTRLDTVQQRMLSRFIASLEREIRRKSA